MLKWFSLFIPIIIIAASTNIARSLRIINDFNNCKCVPSIYCSDLNYVMPNEELSTRDKKCSDMNEICCEPSKISDDYKELRQPSRGCGIRNPEGVASIIPDASNYSNNSNAYFGEFPWMVAIFKKRNRSNKFLCGGSLIHPQVVLTVAHWFENKYDKFKIRVGEWDIRAKNEELKHQDVDVRTVIIYPNLTKSDTNDFALLILKNPVKIEKHVDVVCLPGSNEVFEGKRCLFTGWGKIDGFRERKYLGVLKKVEVPILNEEICKEKMNTHFEGKFEMHDSWICVGGEIGKDTNVGDGGGPLVCLSEQENRYVQAGLLSWGVCRKKNLPEIYGNISYARKWIDEQMVANNIDIDLYQKH